jgi:hypothetical protein
LGKKFYDSLKIGPNFFLQHFKNKIIYNFVKKICGYKKRNDKKFFSPLSFVPVFGFGMRDPGWVKTGSGIDIPDPNTGSENGVWSIRKDPRGKVCRAGPRDPGGEMAPGGHGHGAQDHARGKSQLDHSCWFEKQGCGSAFV